MQQFPPLQPFAPWTRVQPTRLHVAASGLEKASTSLRITQSALVPPKALINTKRTRKRMTKALLQNTHAIVLHALFLNQRSCFRKRRLENQSCRNICAVLVSVFLREFVDFLKTPKLYDAFQCSSEVAFFLATCRQAIVCFFFLFNSLYSVHDIHSKESNIYFNGNPSFSSEN